MENAAVWTAFEAAKQAGKAKHIGVSNFNTYDLTTLAQTAKEPVEVLEAHFGVGLMDWEVMKYVYGRSVTRNPPVHPPLDVPQGPFGTSTAFTLLRPTLAYVRARTCLPPFSC